MEDIDGDEFWRIQAIERPSSKHVLGMEKQKCSWSKLSLWCSLSNQVNKYTWESEEDWDWNDQIKGCNSAFRHWMRLPKEWVSREKEPPSQYSGKQENAESQKPNKKVLWREGLSSCHVVLKCQIEWGLRSDRWIEQNFSHPWWEKYWDESWL